MVYRFAIDETDITGDRWADIFAQAIDGQHLGKPLGVVDVVCGECAWNVKTVKHPSPLKAEKARLIMGRNSLHVSFGISDPLKDISATGDAVLSIWNERLNAALNEYGDLREIVLIRNFNTLQFCLFELDTSRYVEGNYKWRVNKRGNLEGIEKTTDRHCFTWQPSGAHFTVRDLVPGSAKRFSIRRPRVLSEIQKEVIEKVGFNRDWVTYAE